MVHCQHRMEGLIGKMTRNHPSDLTYPPSTNARAHRLHDDETTDQPPNSPIYQNPKLPRCAHTLYPARLTYALWKTQSPKPKRPSTSTNNNVFRLLKFTHHVSGDTDTAIGSILAPDPPLRSLVFIPPPGSSITLPIGSLTRPECG